MIPVLVAIPAKLLFLVALLLGVVTLALELWKRRGNPGAPMSSTPLWLLGAAVGVMGLRGHSIVPSKALFAADWEPIPIHAYGVMLGTAMIIGWFLAMRLSKEDGIPQETAGGIYMWTAVWSIVGARLLWGLTNLQELTPNPLRLFKVWEGGLVAYGGMIGGFLASWYGCRKHKIPLLRWADVSAPSVVLGTAITRVGCLLFGCDYGAVSKTLPWGIRFAQHPPWKANPAPAWQHHFNQGWVTKTDAYSLPVHPTQIYEMLAGLFVFAVVMYLRKVRKFSGEVFVGWVLGYGVLRSIIEIYRDDDDRGVYFGISTSQWIGITSSILAIVLLVKLYQKYRQDPASLRLWEQPLAVPAPVEAAPARARKQRRRAR